MNIKWLVIFFGLSFSSCIEEFNPELDNFNNLLVVDGGITNESGPYTVRLSISSNVNSNKKEKITNAKVIISTKGGVSEVLNETSPGIYKTKYDGIRGAVGKEYKITIFVKGKKYESKYTELKDPIPIDDLVANIENQTLKEDNIEVPGYQFYLSTGKANKTINYFLWFLDGTYKLETTYPIEFIYFGRYYKPRYADTLKTCYVSYKINNVFTGTTKDLAVKQIDNIPLSFIPAIDNRLRIRYSLRVRQYMVNEESYQFWEKIEDQSSSNGSLHTKQPFQIKGNIKCVEDENEVVLGYFFVAGVSSKRIFVDNPLQFYPLRDCSVDTYRIGEYLANSDKFDWPIYLTRSDSGEVGIAGGDCIDCTSVKGASLEKPYFWIE